MAFDQAAVNALIDAAVSHAMATGAFRSVNSHEPKTAPGKGLTASVWAQSIRPVAAGSGLAATSGVVTLNLRIYGNMLATPEDDIDPRLIAAMTALMSEYTGDFTFGGTIRNIDLLGMYGETLSADAGYLEMQGSMYRIMTLTIPCVINDLWVQGGIPSAEETPGRSLQVDSLGVTGGATIGGALAVGEGVTVGGGLAVTGAVSTGGLTISSVPNPTGSFPFGYGNSEALTGLQIVSSYPSDDVSGGTDGTGRISLYSYQRANAYSFGETIRNFLMRWDAKAMTAWYGPTGGSSGSLVANYDGSGNPVGTKWQPWTWVGSHYEANDHGSVHAHWEIEIPDATGALQGRLSVVFGDVTSNAIGLDKTNIATNLADFTFNAHGTDHNGTYQEQYLRVSAPAGFEKPLEFNNATTLANVAAGTRWRILANATAEAGANAGSDLAIRRYDDAGGLLATALFIQRSDGQITTGGAGALGARIGVTWGTSGIAGFYARATSSPGSAAAFYSQLTATSDRLLQSILTGDTSNRFIVQGSGTMLWGPGNATQDTNLYRGGLNLLKTDDSLEVAASLGVGIAPTHVFDVNSSASGGLAQFTRTSTSDTSPVVLILAGDTSTAQAIGVSVNGDAVSRHGVDPTGKLSWGDGTNARDTNLYRSGAGVLRTDQSAEIALNLGVGTVPSASTQRLTVLSGSSAGQVAQFKRTTAADGSPVVTIEAADTSSAQSLGFLVTGDTSNRCGIDANGKVTWGSGSVSRDANLYRSGVGTLATDTVFSAASLGVFTKTPREQLDLASSSAQQNRLRLESFFETDSLGTAEVARLHFGQATGSGATGGSSSKAAIAWFDDTISTTQSQVWVQAHNYLHEYDPQTFPASGVNTSTGVITYTRAGIAPPSAFQVQLSSSGTLPGGLAAATNYYVKILSSSTFSIYTDAGLTSAVTLTSQGSGTHTMTAQLSYNNNHHQHFSVEVSNSDLQNKNTRLSIPWGFDTTEIGFFQCNTSQHDGKFRIVGAAGSFRQLVLGNTLSDNLVPDGTEGRWSIQANATAEGGSNTGSDFRIVRSSDSGVSLDAPVFIQRSTGQIALGNTGNTSPAATVDVESTSAVDVVRAISTATGNPTAALLHGETADTSRRFLDFRVTGDSVSRIKATMTLGSGSQAGFTLGDGTSADTTLYRSGSSVLSTDGYLTVAKNLVIGSQGNSLSSGLVGGIAMANVTTPPANTPSGGGVLYVSAGALLYKGSSGTVTTIAPA